MDNSTELVKCPKCASTELGKGKHAGYTVMPPCKIS
ncbi:hypothetical protein J2R98_001522 [Alkalibacillus filiformis]|uniref:Uncharacterized protein n=1 Tax=Alkalibacillus filiformis TaxID=200990 RepID=A0ABU0DTD7_9BACI|nr:hypothetical protein [Alkalibacillus filiformis]